MSIKLMFLPKLLQKELATESVKSFTFKLRCKMVKLVSFPIESPSYFTSRS